ncbi:MAG TPA: ABC transporter substrate-binding protein [Terriglobales bacterium]|nr:ABC transporter substrate-binding protein [Terriglobales bacterium]
MSFERKWPGRLCAFLFLVAVACRAQSMPGVTPTTIRIGSCSAMSGPASFLGIQTQLGALAYFHLINDFGGVHGRTIELKSRDDGYNPDQTSACFKALLNQDNVFAMGMFVGTPTAAKYVPMAEAAKIPVVGLFTGAQILYEPLKHEVINVRASYFDETREQVESLWRIHARKIAVLYQDDAFGKTVLDGVQRALSKHQLSPAALGTFQRNTLDISAGLKAVRQSKPEAVIIVGPYAPVAAILKEAHASSWHPLFLTVSFVGTEGLIRAAGPDAEGVVITQVVPSYESTDLPTVRLYRNALEKYMSGTSPSFVSLEGFVDAMVIVEGLKAAGKDLTREKFISGIESIHNFDAGLGQNFLLNYSPKDHQGFSSVYATVVREGKAVVLTDWKTLQVE